MTYVNTGAYVNGKRPASKATLRRAIETDDTAVTFDATAAFGPDAGWSLTTSDVTRDVALTVVGPDPYTRRSWYATVRRTASGKVKVS